MGIQTSTINNGPTSGFKNAIINGNFDFWQRGTSFTPISAATRNYTADRWNCYFDGSGATRTISQQAFTNGQTEVPGNPTYFARVAQSVAGTGGTYNQFNQCIEDVRTFAGQQITVSFYAKAAESTDVGVVFSQSFGTGGSPNSFVSNSAGVANVTTSWARYSFTVTLASISGKTIGTNNDSQVELVFALPSNSTFTLDFAQVQVEAGPVATAFERRPIGTELALCQRYFCKSYEINTAPGTPEIDRGNPNSLSSTTLDILTCNISFPVTMRSFPSVTIYRPSTGAVNTVETTFQSDPRTVDGVEAGSGGIGLLRLTTDSPAVGTPYQFQYTASAEL